MKAYIATDRGAELVDRPIPEAGPGQVVAKVHASALNRIDLRMATGYAHGPTGGAGAILGLESAGVVTAVGTGIDGVCVDDRVSGMGGGGFADYVAAHPLQLLPIADGTDFEEAACYPVALRTMYEAIAMSGGLDAGQTVLVQGASTAVGLVGMQMARLLGARSVIGTSTTPDRVARLPAFGADIALNSRDGDWVDAVLAATGGSGVDLTVDMVSGVLLGRTMAATRVLGRIVNVGRLGGNDAPFDAELHAAKRLRLIGTTFRSRTPDEFATITAGVVTNVLPRLEEIRIPIAATFEFGGLAHAMAAMESNRAFGKIVVRHA